MAEIGDSSDEELWEIIGLCMRATRPNRPRVFRDRSDPMSAYNDDEFRMRFRLPRPIFMDLLATIQNELLPSVHRLGAVPPVYQLLIALRFYCSGSFQVTLQAYFLSFQLFII